MSELKCVTCGGELGLRERYEGLLNLLEAGMVVFACNNKVEQNPSNPNHMAELGEASVQMYSILLKYWNDIPGDTIEDKLENIEAKRMFERDDNGNIIPVMKTDDFSLIY